MCWLQSKDVTHTIKNKGIYAMPLGRVKGGREGRGQRPGGRVLDCGLFGRQARVSSSVAASGRTESFLLGGVRGVVGVRSVSWQWM